MLVPIVEAPSEGALTPPSERRGVGAVLGVVLGLAIIVACLVFVLRQPAGGIDGDARLRAAFDLGFASAKAAPACGAPVS